MEKCYEICHIQIPFEKIVDYRMIDREYIYRPAYFVTNEFLRGKVYHFSHMVPYAAIYDEAEYKSPVKAFKAITAGQAIAQEAADGIFGTLGDKLNIKAWKYSKYTCRNQAGRVFTTYIQDVPACVVTPDGKRSEIYPNDELYKELGEPIAPSIEFIPALLILTKDELFTFYGNHIQIDAEQEYNRLKQCMYYYEQEKEASAGKKLIDKIKPAVPKIAGPRISINLPQLGKNANAQRSSLEEFTDMEYASAAQTSYDSMDLNHDGVVDEKDMELLKERLKYR